MSILLLPTVNICEDFLVGEHLMCRCSTHSDAGRLRVSRSDAEEEILRQFHDDPTTATNTEYFINIKLICPRGA